ncbi:tetratricopeptide repeat protein [Alphaproteobacteria bacterium]|nr:tetratricopeptide repeat protein [Alphaproteobacteria bacterium]
MTTFIDSGEYTEDFIDCYRFVSDFLFEKGQDVINFIPFSSFPTPVHTSFRIGNQLFFVHIVDLDDNMEPPGSIEGFISICERFKCVTCLLPVRKKINKWTIENLDWGLIDAKTGDPINPHDLVSDEKLVMSDYEIHQIGVEYVRDYILKKNLGYDIGGFIIDPDIRPSISFYKQDKHCCVLVKVSYDPNPIVKKEDFQDVLEEMKSTYPDMTVYFAGVHLFGQEQMKKKDNSLPLYRGQGYYPNFSRLETFEDEENLKKADIAFENAFQIEDYTLAFKLYLVLAEQGFAPAQMRVGQLYEFALGVEKDMSLAFKWYLRSAERGLYSGQNNVGVCYKLGTGVKKNLKTAFEWFKKAAGDSNRALYNIGLCYRDGEGVEQDYSEAIKIFKSLMDKNDASGICALGVMYYEGKGVPKDYKEAVKLTKLAIKQNDKTSQFNLGEFYEYGRGVKQDNIKALMWYMIALKNGLNESKELIDNLSKKMFPKDINKAEKLANDYLE